MKLLATIKDKSEFKADSLTEEDLDEGVKAVKGKVGDSEDMTIQSLSFDSTKHDKETAKKWMAEKGIEGEVEEIDDEPEEKPEDIDEEGSYDLKGIEIMRVGNWNNTEITKAHLQAMEHAHNKVGSILKPPLKLGHNEKQAFLATDGLPAAGWVTNLKAKGDKLFADVLNIPGNIYKMITKGRYGRFSSEVLFNTEINGQKFSAALKGLALLGADLPAVWTMKDLINLYSYQPSGEKSEITTAELLNIYADKNGGFAPFSADFKGEDDMINEKLQAENKDLRARLDKIEKDRQQEKVQSFIDAQIKEGKMLPSQADFYTSLLMSEQVHKFSRMDEDKLITEDLTTLQLFERIMKEQPSLVNLSAESVDHKPKSKTEDDELHEKAEEYAAKNKVTYKEALEFVAQGVK